MQLLPMTTQSKLEANVNPTPVDPSHTRVALQLWSSSVPELLGLVDGSRGGGPGARVALVERELEWWRFA